MTKPDIVAYHEAGHAVAAVKLRLKLDAVTIAASTEAQGKLSFANPLRGIDLRWDSSDRARMKAEKLIVASLAGPFAQKRYKPRSQWRVAGSGFGIIVERGTDFDKLHGNGKVATRYGAYVCAVAEQLVEQNWESIGRLARLLIERKTLTADEIRAVIVESMLGTGWQARFEAAASR
jgi:hypothetical protein